MSTKTTASIIVDDVHFTVSQNGKPRLLRPVLEEVLMNAEKMVSLSIDEKTVLTEVVDILDNYCERTRREEDNLAVYDYTYTISEDGVFVQKNTTDQ